jgi:hypothetical protein
VLVISWYVVFFPLERPLALGAWCRRRQPFFLSWILALAHLTLNPA